MDKAVESKEHLDAFFRNISTWAMQPDVLYGAVMAACLVSSCLLVAAIGWVITKLYAIRRYGGQKIHEAADADPLQIPTLSQDGQHPYTEAELGVVPKVHLPTAGAHVINQKHGNEKERMHELISEHIKNYVQPNRRSDKSQIV